MDVPPPVSSRSTRFLDQFRCFIRTRGLAYRTEITYCTWVRRFIRFNQYQSPRQLSVHDIQGFLSELAVDRHCSVNTQKTALNALVFLFREFLGQEIPDLHFNKAAVRRKLPTVLSKSEVARVFIHLEGTHHLMAQLMYGCGLRVMEVVRLRVKDIDFDNLPGNTCFLPSVTPPIPVAVWFAGTTWASASFSGRSSWQAEGRRFRSGCPVIPSGIRSRPSCCGRERTFVPYRRYWATRLLRQRRFIPTLLVFMSGAW